jgi:hypothetical protein
VETGVPGVKPPEPVIEEVCHQCLAHKVVHLLVNVCLSVRILVSYRLSLAEPNHHWAQIWSSPASVLSLKGPIVTIFGSTLRDLNSSISFHCIAGLPKDCLIHRFGIIYIPKPVSFENLMAHYDDLEKFCCLSPKLPISWKISSNRRSNEETDDVEEKLGPPSWAPRSSPGFEPVTKTPGVKDVFFVYVPSSAPSLLSSWKTTYFYPTIP